MTRESREFGIVIQVREKKGSGWQTVFKSGRRCSYVLSRIKPEDEHRYLGPYLATELAKLFSDSVVTLVADESIK
jgi:hypothetical protein